MMEITAASLGLSPASTRNTAPQVRAMRLTTLVMVTSPTFWEKEVVGRELKRAEMTEPTPSHTTPPESSLAVASRPMPPSMHPGGGLGLRAPDHAGEALL